MTQLTFLHTFLLLFTITVIFISALETGAFGGAKFTSFNLTNIFIALCSYKSIADLTLLACCTDLALQAKLWTLPFACYFIDIGKGETLKASHTSIIPPAPGHRLAIQSCRCCLDLLARLTPNIVDIGRSTKITQLGEWFALQAVFKRTNCSLTSIISESQT